MTRALKALLRAPLRIADSVADRVVAVVGALLLCQVPGFISHYSQRLGGHLDEARLNVAGWEAIAQGATGGELDALMATYQTSALPAVLETGAKVAADLERLDHLTAAVAAFDSASLFTKPIVLLQHFDSAIVTATLSDYTPNLPVDAEGLVYAFIGLILGIVCYQGGKGLCHVCVRRRRRHRPSHATLPQSP